MEPPAVGTRSVPPGRAAQEAHRVGRGLGPASGPARLSDCSPARHGLCVVLRGVVGVRTGVVGAGAAARPGIACDAVARAGGTADAPAGADVLAVGLRVHEGPLIRATAPAGPPGWRRLRPVPGTNVPGRHRPARVPVGALEERPRRLAPDGDGSREPVRRTSASRSDRSPVTTISLPSLHKGSAATMSASAPGCRSSRDPARPSVRSIASSSLGSSTRALACRRAATAMELAAGTAPSRNSLGRTTSASASLPVVKNPPAVVVPEQVEQLVDRPDGPFAPERLARPFRQPDRRLRRARRSRPPRPGAAPARPANSASVVRRRTWQAQRNSPISSARRP